MRKLLIQLLQDRSPYDITVAYGAEWLANDICSKLNILNAISRQTVQRLTGALKDYADDKIHLRGANKDNIAKYLDFDNWKELESYLKELVREESRTNSGLLYIQGCKAHGEERIKLLIQSAEAGSISAMADLADCYLCGVDTEYNHEEGIKWLHKAADAGHTISAAKLGYEYSDGDSSLVTRDGARGEKYLLIAAEKGFAEAQMRLALLYYCSERYPEAIYWARAAAIENIPEALWILGVCFYEGYGVKENKEEGIQWLYAAAELGDAAAQWRVALAYHEGKYIPKDYQKMCDLLKKSANQGNLMGMTLLGKCYLNGLGIKRNREIGLRWINTAAESGCRTAREFLDENPGL